MSAGNRSVLVILDSRLGEERRSAEQTVFAALDHFGVAWEVLDGGDYMGAIPEYVSPRALYVVAHDGAAEWLKPETARQIADAVADGAGLVSFDRRAREWPEALRALLPADLGDARAGTLRFADGADFITSGHAEGEELELDAEIAVLTLPADERWRPLVTDAEGRAVIAAGEAGEGRVVVFGTGERLYAEGVFGHVRGIDGLMWRSLVWAAAKPFPMRCVPPYVTARMDDCNGTYGAFAYVDVMNRFGISPNLGLFIDEMGPTDWAAVKRLYDSGGADFSMHAFRDDFFMARPNFKPWAVLDDKPDLSEGGTKTVFEGLSLDHETGLDLPDETVRRNFRRMDEAFERAGIRHSRVINAHYGEVGWRAVPHFLERGIDMPCNNSALGQLYGNQPVWRPRPYGIRGTTGRHGLIIDRYPAHPGLTFVSMSVSHMGSHMGLDILSGRVPFLAESETPKLAEAAEAGIRNITIGLDSLAFGVLFTHEERINVISPEDWESVVVGIVDGLDGWDYEAANREHVGVICRRLFDSRLVRVNLIEGDLRCELVGRTDGPSPLTIWENDADAGCARRVVEVEPLDGFTVVSA
ncbi:MAG: hypothetical protein ACOX9R_10630 [Armatimonadota bacterium]|jgi:hypothetical protein